MGRIRASNGSYRGHVAGQSAAADRAHRARLQAPTLHLRRIEVIAVHLHVHPSSASRASSVHSSAVDGGWLLE